MIGGRYALRPYKARRPPEGGPLLPASAGLLAFVFGGVYELTALVDVRLMHPS
jgi:hypothetical protein